jgi:competence/damage-inducible protein CinA-like protein
MTVALLSVGNELLRGETANTNAQWLGEQLTGMGYDVIAIETVADESAVIVAALRRLLGETDLVLVTGGLGPTSDDLTAAAAAEAFGTELALHEDALASIKRRIAERGTPLRAGHEKQAHLPAGCDILPNPVGTAAGFVLRSGRGAAYFMPGVPQEMREMFRHHVAPRIRISSANNAYAVQLRTFGVGESWIAERLEGLETAHPQVVVRYCARAGEVDVRVEARARDYAEARERASAAAQEARRRLGEAVYAEGDQTMPNLVARCLRSRGWRLAVAESCTGGLVAHELTSHPASDYFVGATVAYANTAKTRILGVSEDTLRGHGAVSAEVAAELAEGARRVFDCEVAIGVTGIAGPTGATADKPLGQCFWAVAHPGGTVVEQRVFAGDRGEVQRQAAWAAMNLLRRTLNGGG